MELASRQERRLIRQRGAGVRELKGVEFGFSFGAFAAPGSLPKEHEDPKDDVEARSSLERPVANPDSRKSRGKRKPASKGKASEAGIDQPQRRTRTRAGVACDPKKSVGADGLDNIRAAAPLARTAKTPRTGKAPKTVTEDVSVEASATRGPKEKAPAKRGRPKKQLPKEAQPEVFEDAVGSAAAEPTKDAKPTGLNARQLDVVLSSDSPLIRPRIPSAEAEPEADDFIDAVESQSPEALASSLAPGEPAAGIQAPTGAQRGRRNRIVSSEMPDVEKPGRRTRRAGSSTSALDLSEAVSQTINGKEDVASANAGLPSKRAQKRSPQQTKTLPPKRLKMLAAVPEKEETILAEARPGFMGGADESREVAVEYLEAVRADQASEAQYAPSERLKSSKARSHGHTTRPEPRSTNLFAKTTQYKRPQDRTAEAPGDLASILRRYGDPKIPAKLTTNVDSRLNFRF